MNTARETFAGRTALEEGRWEETEERTRRKGRGKARSRLFRVRLLGLEVITEIDAHPSDPSCSLRMDERVWNVCVCVCMAAAAAAAATFSPMGPGNRFIGHPVRGI